ncbi:MAG: hypothetical protein WCB36_01995 [Burkholderiales bacterium]
MPNSKNIAGLLGPTLIAISASEALNFHIWATNSAAVIYLNGTLLWIGGLAIVRAHNHWVRGWPVIISLIGWFIMILGLFRMFFPEAQQLGQGRLTYAGLTALCAIGVFLTVKGYSRKEQHI